jgi:acyl carrier protein
MDQNDRTALRTFIEELLGEHDDHAPFGDTESLIKSGRLDSLSVTKIVMFLETTFGVDFTRVEFDPDRLDSVAEIAAVIEESRGPGQGDTVDARSG